MIMMGREARILYTQKYGSSQNPVANVPSILPAVLIAEKLPTVSPLPLSPVRASLTAYGETMPRSRLVGEKRIIAAITELTRISFPDMRRNSRRGYFVSKAIVIAIALP